MDLKSLESHVRSKEKQPPQAQLQPQQKKQVRRRIHATKSYQGKVMNMAEARREIVTALRIHRSLMKANETHKNQLHSTSQQDHPSSSLLTDKSYGEMNSRRTTMMYPFTDTNSITHSCSFRNNFSTSNSYPPDFHCSSYPSMEVGTVYDKLNSTLSSRYPLGLNPNYSNPDTGFSNNSSNPSISSSYCLTPNSFTLSSSSSSSYSDTSSTMVSVHESKNEESTATLHPVMDDERMAEIQSIGEQHALEWNDKLNMTTMLWWYELLNTSETSPFTSQGNHEGQAELEEAEEIPYWNCEEQQLDLCTPEINYSQHDPMFPWQ